MPTRSHGYAPAAAAALAAALQQQAAPGGSLHDALGTQPALLHCSVAVDAGFGHVCCSSNLLDPGQASSLYEASASLAGLVMRRCAPKLLQAGLAR